MFEPCLRVMSRSPDQRVCPVGAMPTPAPRLAPSLPLLPGDLAVKLGGIAGLHPAVRIGSYPNVAIFGDKKGEHQYKVCGVAGCTLSRPSPLPQST